MCCNNCNCSSAKEDLNEQNRDTACCCKDTAATSMSGRQDKSELQIFNDGLVYTMAETIRKQLLGLSFSEDLAARVKFLKRELNAAGHDKNNTISHNLIAVVTLIELLDKKVAGFSKYHLGQIDDVYNFKPLTPLTFDDDEFVSIGHLDLFDTPRDMYQNRRNSSVFKEVFPDKPAEITSTEALTLNITSTVDISKKELKRYDSVHDDNTFCGKFFVYDRASETWFVTSHIQHILIDSDYRQEKFYVDAIELYDSTDEENPYYAFIAEYGAIPADFFKYYELKVLPGDDDDALVLYALQEEHMEKCFDLKVNLIPDLFNGAEIDGDKVLVHCSYLKAKNLLQKALFNNGLGYSKFKLSEQYQGYNDMTITFKNDKRVIDALSGLLNDYGVTIKQTNNE